MFELQLKNRIQTEDMGGYKVRVTDAVMTEISMDMEKPLCISSRANIMPARGAWKAAARPALAPHVIRNLSSVLPRSSILDSP